MSYDDVVFYCASCLQCTICGQKMSSDKMYQHCADSHLVFEKNNSADTRDADDAVTARCPVCPGAGNPDHLIGHVMSSHASCRVRL